MADAGAGITFRETMAGGFALGETDPSRGERAGAQAGTTLVLSVSLSIPSVRRFVRDAEHAGTLTGSVSVDPLGGGLPSDSGFFKLFTPTSDPAVKLMQYRMAFRVGSAAYCLHGVKEIRRGSPLRGWKDTTTLRCRLHSGADDSGEVVGAGVLRLGILSFAQQLLSFRAINAHRPGDGPRAFGGFLRFFAGELIESYL